MNKKKDNTGKEESVSDLIDQQNRNKKPKTNVNQRFDEDSLEYDMPNISTVRKSKPSVLRLVLKYKKLVAIACLVIVLLAVNFLNIPGFQRGIVYAMVESYERLNSVSGVLEYSNRRGNEHSQVEIINFEFKKPNAFVLSHQSDMGIVSKTYDGGDIMYTEFSGDINRVRVDFMDEFMQKEQLRWLLLSNIAEELLNDTYEKDEKRIPGEVIAGRKTEGYEFTYNINGNITIHRVWVDKKIDLPLKWEIIYPGCVNKEGKVIPEERITTTFTEIVLNPEIDDGIFNYEYDKNKVYYINNPPVEKEQLKKYEYLFDSDTVKEYESRIQSPTEQTDIPSVFDPLNRKLNIFIEIIEHYIRNSFGERIYELDYVVIINALKKIDESDLIDR